MKSYAVEIIPFKTYMKLCSLLGASFGLGLGMLCLIISLLGADVKTTVGSAVLTGIPAGVASPLIGLIMFLIFGLIGYLPFKMFMKIKGKIVLRLEAREE